MTILPYLKLIEVKEEVTAMRLSELIGWIIGALDLAFMVYSMVDFTPFILMVGISLTYIAIIIIKNRKLKKKKVELTGFSNLRKQM